MHKVNLEPALVAVVCLMQAGVIVVILSLLAVDYDGECDWVLHGNKPCTVHKRPTVQRILGRQSITKEQCQELGGMPLRRGIVIATPEQAAALRSAMATLPSKQLKAAHMFMARSIASDRSTLLCTSRTPLVDRTILQHYSGAFQGITCGPSKTAGGVNGQRHPTAQQQEEA